MYEMDVDIGTGSGSGSSSGSGSGSGAKPTLAQLRQSNGMMLLDTMQTHGEPTTIHGLTQLVAGQTPQLSVDHVRTEVRRFLHAGNKNGFIEHDPATGTYSLHADPALLARGAKARRKKSGSTVVLTSAKRGRSKSRASLKGGDGKKKRRGKKRRGSSAGGEGGGKKKRRGRK